MISEIKTLRKVQHPNIIKLFEIYESEQYVHLVFEYLKGCDIFSKIKTRPRYTEADACKIMRAILNAVFTLHSKQIIHRDLNAEHIIIL